MLKGNCIEKDGHYQTTLLWKTTTATLPDTFEISMRSLCGLAVITEFLQHMLTDCKGFKVFDVSPLEKIAAEMWNFDPFLT
ncbi:hypothetical protein GQX74_011366 [Glossina fuscipes]|nr:hypothetical protein GQX74_011366 [Glossina fuscipes]